MDISALLHGSVLEVLIAVVSFIGVLSIIVFVQEYGHFKTARLCGVRVETFSVGFGRSIGGFHDRHGTHWKIGWLPLGGYVKMLDEREGEVKPDELHRAFNRQTLATRSAVVAAGPLFNFLFAILSYWVMYASGVPGMRPVIGEVIPDSPAET